MADLKLEMDDTFFTGEAYSSCSSNGSFGSFSSSSSSSTTSGYVTPISGRSSPRHPGPLDFDASLSFDMPITPYDLTPPSTAGSGYFALDGRSSMDMGMVPDGLPMTPSPYPNVLGDNTTLPYHATYPQITTQHRVDSYPFGDALNYSMFNFPTPANSVNGGATVEMSDLIRGDMDSPISFAFNDQPTLRSSPMIKREDSPSNFHTSRRLFAGEVQQRSAVLQQRVLSRECRIKKEKTTKRTLPENFSFAASGRFKCLELGCGGKHFKRLEHLKRHMKTHSQNPEVFQCEFCSHHVKARKDNWRQHLTLHARPEAKGGRVKFFPKAVLMLEEEMRRLKRNVGGRIKQKTTTTRA